MTAPPRARHNGGTLLRLPVPQFQRILVVVPAQIGDVYLCTPLIRLARSRWPEAQVDVLGFAGTLALLAGNPDVSGRIEIDRSQGLKGQLRQAAQLWRRYDLALVTRASDRAHLYGFVAARCRSAMVPDRGPGSRWKRWIAQHAFTPDGAAPQVLEHLRLLSPWAAPADSVSLAAPPSQPLPPEVERQLRHPFVVVHAPSMWRYKQWPIAHYREVIDGLLSDGVQVVLTGSNSGNDQGLVAALRDAGAPPALLDVSGRLALAQVGTLLGRAAAYLGPDTSVTHLATSLGIPTVTVYGPTPPDSFGPWPSGHPATQPWSHRAQRQQVHDIVMLQGGDLPGQQCVPCGRMGCENRHDSESHCLATLDPQRVLVELRAVLARRADAAARRPDAQAINSYGPPRSSAR